MAAPPCMGCRRQGRTRSVRCSDAGVASSAERSPRGRGAETNRDPEARRGKLSTVGTAEMVALWSLASLRDAVLRRNGSCRFSASRSALSGAGRSLSTFGSLRSAAAGALRDRRRLGRRKRMYGRHSGRAKKASGRAIPQTRFTLRERTPAPVLRFPSLKRARLELFESQVHCLVRTSWQSARCGRSLGANAFSEKTEKRDLAASQSIVRKSSKTVKPCKRRWGDQRLRAWTRFRKSITWPLKRSACSMFGQCPQFS